MTYPNTPLPSTAATDTDASAKDKATNAAQTGKQAAGEVAQTATDAAKDVAQETGKQARDLLGKTREQINDQASTQKQSLVESLRSLVDQLGEMTEHVEQQGTAVDLAASARDRARGAADWLDGREPAQVLDELRDVGRRRPGAFILGSLVAGVAAGRLTRGVVAVHTDDGSDDTSARDMPVQSTGTHARGDHALGTAVGATYQADHPVMP